MRMQLLPVPPVWYILVQSNQSNSESADSENYRVPVVNSAYPGYELRIQYLQGILILLNSTYSTQSLVHESGPTVS